MVVSLISMLCMARFCEEIGWTSVPQLEANVLWLTICCLLFC